MKKKMAQWGHIRSKCGIMKKHRWKHARWEDQERARGVQKYLRHMKGSNREEPQTPRVYILRGAPGSVQSLWGPVPTKVYFFPWNLFLLMPRTIPSVFIFYKPKNQPETLANTPSGIEWATLDRELKESGFMSPFATKYLLMLNVSV